MILSRQFCFVSRNPTCMGRLLPSQSTQYLSTYVRSINCSENLLATSATNSAFSQMHDSASSKANLMLILGKPGGGKGTISKKILKDFPSFHYLSTGDVLRQHVKNQTDLGMEAKKHMDEGSLVPDELMIRLVMESVKQAEENDTSLLLDGFPRSLKQAIALDKTLQVDIVVNLNIPTETIVERISERWIHAASGRVYNNSYNPPRVEGKDDETGEDLVQRDDDKPETVRKRLKAYEEVTAPLVEYYNSKGVLKSFKGTMSDVIYPEVHDWLNDQLLKD